MSTTKDDQKQQQKKMDEDQARYLKAELEREKARKQPSKVSDYKIVAMLQDGDELLPIYRYNGD